MRGAEPASPAAASPRSVPLSSGGRSSAAICDRAGVPAGVGSNVTQPQSSNHASTHECASVSRTIHARLLFE